MTCFCTGAHFFASSALASCAHLFRTTRVSRNLGKIVISRLPTEKQLKGDSATSSSVPSSLLNRRGRSEYRENQNLDPAVTQFLSDDAANTLRRRQQLDQFCNAADDAVLKVWRDSKSHLRLQESLVKELGVEGAVQEVLQPTRTSFRQELRQRPLDRGILEEIYKGLHGKRVERRLKRGVSWEHWITKGDGTAPVFTASQKAQQTFAFGGTVKLTAKALHAKQFPVILSGGRRAAGGGDGTESNKRHMLVPEVAFVGRTSSGKSSLVNAVLNSLIAPYGHLQGTTSSVNFYDVAGKVVLVDCPGYGYYNPMETPLVDAENAVAVMRAYLAACSSNRNRKKMSLLSDSDTSDQETLRCVRPIKRVFVCVSSRGMQHSDIAYLDYLEKLGVSFSVILTKTDGAPIRFLARLADYTRCKLVHYKHCKELMLTSSLRLAGIDKMQNLIGSMALGEDKLHGATADFSSIV